MRVRSKTAYEREPPLPELRRRRRSTNHAVTAQVTASRITTTAIAAAAPAETPPPCEPSEASVGGSARVGESGGEATGTGVSVTVGPGVTDTEADGLDDTEADGLADAVVAVGDWEAGSERDGVVVAMGDADGGGVALRGGNLTPLTLRREEVTVKLDQSSQVTRVRVGPLASA